MLIRCRICVVDRKGIEHANAVGIPEPDDLWVAFVFSLTEIEGLRQAIVDNELDPKQTCIHMKSGEIYYVDIPFEDLTRMWRLFYLGDDALSKEFSTRLLTSPK